MHTSTRVPSKEPRNVASPKVTIAAPKDSGGMLRTSNNAGKPAVEVATAADGGGSLVLFNNRQKQILTLLPDKTSAGAVGLHDAEGVFKRALGITP